MLAIEIKDKDKEKLLNELVVGVRERIGKHRDSLAELADEVIQLQVDDDRQDEALGADRRWR